MRSDLDLDGQRAQILYLYIRLALRFLSFIKQRTNQCEVMIHEQRSTNQRKIDDMSHVVSSSRCARDEDEVLDFVFFSE